MQRIAVVTSEVGHPEVILLYWPLSHLKDPNGTDGGRELVYRVAEKSCIQHIYVSKVNRDFEGCIPTGSGWD